jgi:hypothetical protein
MPNRKEHLKISKDLLGYCNPMVHDILDKSLPIAEHRRTHRPETCQLIGQLLGKDAEREAWLHLFADYGIVKTSKL